MTRYKSWVLTDVVNDVWVDSFGVANDTLRHDFRTTCATPWRGPFTITTVRRARRVPAAEPSASPLTNDAAIVANA